MVVEENELAVQIPGNVTVELAMRCVDTTRVIAPAELYETYMENRLEHALCLEEGYQVCSGGDGGGTKKRKEGRKKMDGGQEWDTRVLLAVPTSNAAASRRRNRVSRSRRAWLWLGAGCPWRVKLAPRFSISKGASSFFSAISGFFRAKPYPKSQKIFSLREKGELFLFFGPKKVFFEPKKG